jgi:uncharacterized protein (TIGR02246 family)
VLATEVLVSKPILTARIGSRAAVLSLLIVFATAIAAPSAGPATPRDLLATLMRADNASDLEGVLGLYADDAVLLPPNEPVVTGKAAIRARYTKMFATTRMEVRFEVDDDAVGGSIGFLRGRTIGRRISTGGGRVEDLTGKFVMVLKRSGDGWAIASLIWNADR